MNTKQLRRSFCAMTALVAVTLGFGARATPEQAVNHARSVVLVRQVMEDGLVHSYVKEVWRSSSDTATLPAVGSEYGRPKPYTSSKPFAGTDAIVFEFGSNRSDGLPHTMQISVTEKRRVPFFMEAWPVTDDEGVVKRMKEEPMHVEDLRQKVKRTKPKA